LNTLFKARNKTQDRTEGGCPVIMSTNAKRRLSMYKHASQKKVNETFLNENSPLRIFNEKIAESAK
jgi:hypothetical protein